MLVLDSGGFTRLARASTSTLATIRALRSHGLWPPVVPTVVLAESLRGNPRRDANEHRFLRLCLIEASVPLATARRADELRVAARAGSVVDALVVALAEPGGTVLTGDTADLRALAAHARGVHVERV